LIYETIEYVEEDRLAHIVLNRPSALNALNHQMRMELKHALKEAADHSAIRVVMLSSASRAFSVGQDLKELDENYAEHRVSLGELVRSEYVPLVQALQTMPKPTIALLQGTAVGGGMSLALACDFRVLSVDAQLIAGFVKVGLVPDTGTSYLLPRMIGDAQALRIFLTGSAIRAQEAVQLGLADMVHPSAEAAATRARELAYELAEGPTLAYAEIRQLVQDGHGLSLDLALSKEIAAQERLSHTQDHRDAVSSFLGKKIPRFKGQ